MEADAQAYGEVNKPQIEAGIKFISELNLSPGSKVLDMGCGTGEVTKYISDIVGSEGLAVGIDPDAARIKLATEKFNGVSNLEYHAGSSAIGFPHDNEPYYDAHVSTMAFHWVPPDEKNIYIQKAYQCLKPEGSLAILCTEGQENDKAEVHAAINHYPLTQDGYQKLFVEAGVFTNVVFKRVMFPMHLKSFEELKRWTKASTDHDLDEVDPAVLKEKMGQFLTIHDDGSISLTFPALSITATKT